AGGSLHGAEEAAGVADGKELFGIGAARAITTHFLGRSQGDIEHAIIGSAVAGATASRGGARRVHDLGHQASPWVYDWVTTQSIRPVPSQSRQLCRTERRPRCGNDRKGGF